MDATQARIGEQITALMSDVDRWLCTLMDPNGKSFLERELIENYGWADVDILQLEMDEAWGLDR